MRKTNLIIGAVFAFFVCLVSMPLSAEKSNEEKSEGKILFVDTSDAGKTYLATMNPDGSGKIRLTPSFSNIVFPKWSEKSGWIGFTNKLPDMTSEVYLLNGKATKITKFRDGVSLEAFSPDGKFLLYSTCNQNPELFAYSIKTKVSTKISTDQKITAADWSPDGNWIVASALMDDGTNDLYLFSTLAQGIVRLTNTPGISESFPAFSSDGNHIAYICDRNGRSEIEFMNKETKEFKRPIIVGLYPSISPDDSKVTYEAGTDIAVSKTNGLEQKAICKGRTPYWVK
ncbi:MAG: PD40 domain-containing protein [Candidatus Riflebacteria bacterium]|nr:PD40 domain-containing protein [Candidatus Riflebacteria bacterium]